MELSNSTCIIHIFVLLGFTLSGIPEQNSSQVVMTNGLRDKFRKYNFHIITDIPEMQHNMEHLFSSSSFIKAIRSCHILFVGAISIICRSEVGDNIAGL